MQEMQESVRFRFLQKRKKYLKVLLSSLLFSCSLLIILK